MENTHSNFMLQGVPEFKKDGTHIGTEHIYFLLSGFGEIEKVSMISNDTYVCLFINGDDAKKAYTKINGARIEGSIIISSYIH